MMKSQNKNPKNKENVKIIPNTETNMRMKDI